MKVNNLSYAYCLTSDRSSISAANIQNFPDNFKQIIEPELSELSELTNSRHKNNEFQLSRIYFLIFYEMPMTVAAEECEITLTAMANPIYRSIVDFAQLKPFSIDVFGYQYFSDELEGWILNNQKLEWATVTESNDNGEYHITIKLDRNISRKRGLRLYPSTVNDGWSYLGVPFTQIYGCEIIIWQDGD